MGILWLSYGEGSRPEVDFTWTGVRRVSLLVRDDEELDGIEEILPDDIRRGAEGCHRMEISLCHPNAEGGVLLSKRLSGGDGGDASHGGRCSGRIDEDILVVRALGRRRHEVTDQLAETELKEAGEEGGY